jgi:hypothetical protein
VTRGVTASEFALGVTSHAAEFFHKPLDFAGTRQEQPVSRGTLDRVALSSLNVRRTPHLSKDNNNELAFQLLA